MNCTLGISTVQTMELATASFFRDCLFYPYFQQGSTIHSSDFAEFYSFNYFPFEHQYPYNAQWCELKTRDALGLPYPYYDVFNNIFSFQQCNIDDWPVNLSQLPVYDRVTRFYNGIYEVTSKNSTPTSLDCEPNPIFVYFNAAYKKVLYFDALDTKVSDGGSGEYYVDAGLNSIVTTPTVDFSYTATDNIFGYPLKYFVSQNKNQMELFWNTERVNVSILNGQNSYVFAMCEPYIGPPNPFDNNTEPTGNTTGTSIDPNTNISYLVDTATYIDKIEFKSRIVNGIEVFQIDRNVSSNGPDFYLPLSFFSNHQYVIVSGDVQYGNVTKKIYKKIVISSLPTVSRVNLFFHKQPESYNIRIFLK